MYKWLHLKKNKLELVIVQLYPQIVILIKVDILAMKIWALGEVGQKFYVPVAKGCKHTLLQNNSLEPMLVTLKAHSTLTPEFG